MTNTLSNTTVKYHSSSRGKPHYTRAYGTHAIRTLTTGDILPYGLDNVILLERDCLYIVTPTSICTGWLMANLMHWSLTWDQPFPAVSIKKGDGDESINFTVHYMTQPYLKTQRGSPILNHGSRANHCPFQKAAQIRTLQTRALTYWANRNSWIPYYL